MSKYDEICQAYSKSRRTFRNYEETCRNFARDLVAGLVDYLDWPRENEISYIPLGDEEEFDPNNRFYALAGAMNIDDQSFWHFGVELTVHEPNTGAHPISFIISFFIKKVGPYFIVKLGPKGKEIKIPESKQHELEPFYDAVFGQILDFFNRKYYQAVAREEKHFGFITLV